MAVGMSLAVGKSLVPTQPNDIAWQLGYHWHGSWDVIGVTWQLGCHRLDCILQARERGGGKHPAMPRRMAISEYMHTHTTKRYPHYTRTHAFQNLHLPPIPTHNVKTALYPPPHRRYCERLQPRGGALEVLEMRHLLHLLHLLYFLHLPKNCEGWRSPGGGGRRLRGLVPLSLVPFLPLSAILIAVPAPYSIHAPTGLVRSPMRVSGFGGRVQGLRRSRDLGAWGWEVWGLGLRV
jgi:hypothetical protein